MASLPLPVDVFLAIFRHVNVRDIVNIRLTCKSFLEMTQLRSVWHRLLRNHVLEQNLPVPGLTQRAIPSFSAAELERHTFRALRLRKNWTSSSPIATNQVEISTTSQPQSPIQCLQFLPGKGHRWLLSITLTSDRLHRNVIVLCWDVEASPPVCFARRYFTELASFAVNTDPASPAILALQLPHIEIFNIDFTATDPDSAFVRIAVFPTRMRELHVFSGNTLLTRDGNHRLSIWNIHSPETEVELRNPQVPQPERCFSAILHGEFVILLHFTTLEIYALPSFRANVPPGGRPSARILHPTAQHKWPLPINNVCISQQASWSAAQSHTLPPISILIRFGSGYGWPINILHHYMLHPNAFYAPSDDIDTDNLPYLFPPMPIQTVASPVRLFATTDMALGSHGTALWIDSHTEDYFDHSDHGQRLASSVLTRMNVEHDGYIDPADLVAFSATSVATTVFGVQESDGWVRVALDEEEGRVAVGSASGKISLWRYV